MTEMVLWKIKAVNELVAYAFVCEPREPKSSEGLATASQTTFANPPKNPMSKA